MRTNYVLIDYENVQPASLALLEAECFEVLLFVGASQARVPVDLASTLQPLGKRASYVKISGNGSNALDFHIAYYIGRRSVENPHAYFHVISKDSGFDPLIQHLRDGGIHVSRWEEIKAIPLCVAANPSMKGERLRLVVDRLRSGKVTRPRTEKSLGKWIAAQFHGQPGHDQIADLIARLQAGGVITIEGGDVTYDQPETVESTS